MKRRRFKTATARGLRPAFTMIEVLATLVLLGIVLPIALRGVSLATVAASTAKHTSEAAALAQSKLNELVVENLASTSSQSGDCGADYPGYHWSATGVNRDYNLFEVTVTITWSERGQERNFRISTLVPNQNSSQTAATGN